MAVVWIVLSAVLVVAVAVFHAFNPQAVDLNLYGYSIFGVPHWMLVTIPAVVGLALGILLDIPDRVRSALQGRRLTGQVNARDKTIAELQAQIVGLDRDLAAARAAHAAAASAVDVAQTPVIVEEVRQTPPELPRAV